MFAQVARKEVGNELNPGQQAQLRGQARRGTSLWMASPLADGDAPADATWQVMMRQRTLMTASGATTLDPGERRCAHRAGQPGSGICRARLTDDATHEALCNLGGGPTIRHDRVREWLGSKLKEAFGGRTQTEVPHPLARGMGMGRMDLKHNGAQGHLDVDVTIVSIRSSCPAERLRRKTAPDRALRAGVWPLR